ncbi:hypothetical protein BDQ94DRAFT_155823, partial [Aspergillus welwitschiae]
KSRDSNEKRTRLRPQCREALANHICNSFPAQIRSTILNKLTYLDDRLAVRVYPRAVRLKQAQGMGMPGRLLMQRHI